MTFKEIELKYNAEGIALTKFLEFCEDRNPVHKVVASGYDHFYDSKTDVDAFCRYRFGPDMNQLTFKRKLNDANNVVRTEHNLDMTAKMGPQQVKALLGEFGYKFNRSIFKNCFVYNYEDHTLVYYICYDTDMKELGRFFEIEAKEDYPWVTQADALDCIMALEKLFKPLGVSPQCRIKRSLFEMFRK